ncbi:GntR family transcriptional regulator [Microbacterium oxydans]|uniref:GntR family transcriptional regulator n=1 Tax=Microbacterium sp. B19(2022) TaxID=2914045 RepID=UPI001430C674|nr:GntR family transcriptional regulator [Microbacterium sp. B19(2022)]NJI60934.1 GntR family transcriptional regulator [Microbacterium sp. B19(2022)]
MALSGGPVDRTRLGESAYARLRSAIIAGDLEPGAMLGVYETAKAFGTSRAPVQVALDLLAREGLVEVYRNSYSRVASVDRESTRKAVDVLTDVWTGAVRRFLPRAGEEEVAALSDLTTQMAATIASRDVASFGDVLEELAVSCSKGDASPERASIVRQTCAHVHRYWLFSDRAFDWDAAETLTAVIRPAIRSRDAAGACDAITGFLDDVAADAS